MKFKVLRADMFKEEFGKLPGAEQERIRKFEKHLSDNPFVGKPLGFVFLREKRLNGRRIYYLIYEEFVMVLMVCISNKKGQQAKINAIKAGLDYYHQLVRGIPKEPLSLFPLLCLLGF